MNQRVIYPNDDGGVAIVVPAPEWLSQEGNTMESLAEQVVPKGRPFKIVNMSEIPSDRTFRGAWEFSQ